ncbi:MAG: CGGC domain-containing protein, partial [Candidatus Sumerlaeota bacterium]|nr:CGGC domain-containing protein [Candidatus Sumerlaeota bacterium]
MPGPDYLVVVQCDIVKQSCPGYNCERAYHERTGGFADLPRDQPYRTLYLTCGGCCGRAIHRKLSRLARELLKREGIKK